MVALVDEDELARRNEGRAHPVPPEVLTSQLLRFTPPYLGEAHRTWCIGDHGTVDDAEGILGGAVDAGEV